MSRTALCLCLALCACSGRTVSWDDGAIQDSPGPRGDARPTQDLIRGVDLPRDRAVPWDAPAPCGGPQLSMGLVSTFFDGQPSTTLVRTEPGQVIYHGKVTQPLASSPLFDREIQLMTYAGDILVVQYYLPPGLVLPLSSDSSAMYSFTMKRRMIGTKAFTHGLIIKGNTPGPWPFVLIAEPATYGQAFAPSQGLAPLTVDDPLISPLKVLLLERTDCPVSTTPGCAPRYIDRLRFEATTGAGLIAAQLEQGEVIGLTLFGQKMRLANLASYHQRPPCGDDEPERLSYVVVAAP